MDLKMDIMSSFQKDRISIFESVYKIVLLSFEFLLIALFLLNTNNF